MGRLWTPTVWECSSEDAHDKMRYRAFDRRVWSFWEKPGPETQSKYSQDKVGFGA